MVSQQATQRTPKVSEKYVGLELPEINPFFPFQLQHSTTTARPPGTTRFLQIQHDPTTMSITDGELSELLILNVYSPTLRHRFLLNGFLMNSLYNWSCRSDPKKHLHVCVCVFLDQEGSHLAASGMFLWLCHHQGLTCWCRVESI